MEEIKTDKANKKEKFGVNKASKLNFNFTSILKLILAIALFLMAALFISGAGVIVENGALNISNNLLVNTNALFVDSINDRVGINTTSPSYALTIQGGLNVSGNLRINPTGDSIIKSGGNSANGVILQDDLGTTYLNLNRNNGFLMSAPLQWSPGGTYDIGTGINNNDPRNMFLRGYAAIGGSGGTNQMIQLNGSSSTANSWFNGGNVGIGTASPTHKLHVVGSENLTGTLYYGALQSQSPHALVQRGARGQLEPTEICIVTTAGNVLSVKFNDLGAALTSINSTSCMEKQTLESVEFIYNETLQQNVTIEHRRHVFR